MLKVLFLASLTLGVSAVPTAKHYAERDNNNNSLDIKLSVENDLLDAPTDGRIVLMFAPNGTDPLDDTDVTSSPNKIFGKNVHNFGPKQSVSFSGGSNDSTTTGV